MFDVIGEVDERKVADALNVVPHKRKMSWVKWSAIAACLCLVIVGVFSIFPHYETAALADIEAVCGSDLLLDKMTLSDNYFSNYNLEIIENGSFDNPEDWKSLSVDVNYGNGIVDTDNDNLICFISFDGSTDGVYIMDFLNDAATVEVNGYTVEYNEMSLDEAAADGLALPGNLDYHGWAKFTHNGYAYYIATQSDNPDFFELTLEQMLK